VPRAVRDRSNDSNNTCTAPALGRWRLRLCANAHELGPNRRPAHRPDSAGSRQDDVPRRDGAGRACHQRKRSSGHSIARPRKSFASGLHRLHVATRLRRCSIIETPSWPKALYFRRESATLTYRRERLRPMRPRKKKVPKQHSNAIWDHKGAEARSSDAIRGQFFGRANPQTWGAMQTVLPIGAPLRIS
jgi:hypothetical protein